MFEFSHLPPTVLALFFIAMMIALFFIAMMTTAIARVCFEPSG